MKIVTCGRHLVTSPAKNNVLLHCKPQRERRHNSLRSSENMKNCLSLVFDILPHSSFSFIKAISKGAHARYYQFFLATTKITFRLRPSHVSGSFVSPIRPLRPSTLHEKGAFQKRSSNRRNFSENDGYVVKCGRKRN